jgi:hypothetical protein
MAGFGAAVAFTVRLAGNYGFWVGARVQTRWGTSEPFADTLLYGVLVFCLLFAVGLLIPNHWR